MSELRDNHPFHSWVPRPVGIVVLLLMFVPPTFSGGAYLSNLNEMAGSLGWLTEDVQLAGFFTSIGMCLFPPFMLRFLQTRRIRQTYLWCFLLLVPLNYCCAVTTSLPVLLIACLLTGFVRVMVMIHCTFTIAPYLTGMDTLAMFTMNQEPTPDVQYMLERKRTFLMPMLYFYILVISQGSNVLTAWFAYAYRWQHAYYVVIAMLLVGMLLVTFLMPGEKRKTGYRPEWEMLPDMLLMVIALCCMAYMLVYGKTLGWWAAPGMRWALSVLLVVSSVFLFLATRRRKHHYLPLEVFGYRNVWMSMLLFVLTMVLYSANMLVGIFIRIATPASNLHIAALGGWAVVGCVAGLVVSLVLVVCKVRFRVVFVTAFMLMAAANAVLYFRIQTIGLYSGMVLPTVLNYMGLLMLYSLAAAFGMKHLPSRYLVTYVFLMIWMRNAIAPVVGASVYANWFYERQQHDIGRQAHSVDHQNTLASATYMQAIRTGQRQGKGTDESERMAVTLLKGRVTVQASLVAIRNMAGSTVWWLIGAAALAMVLPYHKGETT